MVTTGQIFSTNQYHCILENVGLVTKIKILGGLQPELQVKQQVVAIMACHGNLGTNQRWFYRQLFSIWHVLTVCQLSCLYRSTRLELYVILFITYIFFKLFILYFLHLWISQIQPLESCFCHLELKILKNKYPMVTIFQNPRWPPYWLQRKWND